MYCSLTSKNMTEAKLSVLFYILIAISGMPSASFWSLNKILLTGPKASKLSWNSSLYALHNNRIPPHLSLAESVSRGITLGMGECRHQFRWEPWNCPESDVSSIQYNHKLRSNKETSFVQAITTAGVMFVLTKNCSTGHLADCTCNEDGRKTKGQWQWDGCGDGVQFGDRLSRKYIDGVIYAGNLRSIVNLHNNGVGRKSVWRMLKVSCKCHGVSGSCSIRTCWRILSDFRSSGKFLKKRYNKAVGLRMSTQEIKHIGKLRTIVMATLSSKDLAYIDESPSYCTANVTLGIRGTEGRHCSRPRRGIKVAKSEKLSCRRLCSQCGFVVRKYTVATSTSCNCKFYWCCSVKCKQCNIVVQKYYCHRPQ